MNQNDCANTLADLRARALAGVLRGALDGELPLFTWTLGLPQDEHLNVVSAGFPGVDPMEPLLAPHYARLLDLVPKSFEALACRLEAQHKPPTQSRPAYWLARVVAAACFGERHLWEDMGLADQTQLRMLLCKEFPALSMRNRQGTRWKHFLLTELSRPSQHS